MKTAISLPDEDFDRVTSRAKHLGVSRSEFFVTAARHYLDELDSESVTRQINAALDQLREPDRETAAAVDAAHATFGNADEEW